MRSSKYGGLERFMEKLVTMDSGNDYVLIYTASIVTPDYEEKLRSAGVTLYYWPVAGRHCWSFAWRFLRLLLRIKPQVVHAHFDPAGYIALLFSYLCGIEKRIKTVHSGLPDTLPLKTRCLFSLMHHWATDVICVSEGIISDSCNCFLVGEPSCLFCIWGWRKSTLMCPGRLYASDIIYRRIRC